MSFTQRNLPRRASAGPEIPYGVRQSILAVLHQQGISPTALWVTLNRKHGWGTWQEIAEDIEERFSSERGEQFQDAIANAKERDKGRNWAQPGVDYMAEPALQAIPEPYFLDAIEYGYEQLGGGWGGGLPEASREINELFERRAVYFRIDAWGRAEWVGDPGAWTIVAEPALAVLQDPRLAGTRGEFDAARTHLRHGANKDLEDAIEEAGKAVESAMKVLLDAHGVALTGKETAKPLFDLLRANGIVEAEADNTVLGAMRIRNQWGGHGAGSAPRTPMADLADLCVQSAASAIVYLAARLP